MNNITPTNSPRPDLIGQAPWKYVILLLPLGALAILGGCTPPPPPKVQAVRPVNTMVVASGEDSRIRSFPGRVEASNNVQLAFQVSGLLVDLPVREGQNVKKGDVLARLRSEEFEARLKALQSQLDSGRSDLQALRAGVRAEERLRLEAQVRAAEANLANARSEFGRSEQLLQSRVISPLEHDRAITAYRVSQENYKVATQTLEQGIMARQEDIDSKEAAVRGIESRVVEANLQLQDSTLRAPYDGVIAQRFVEQGQNITAGQPVIKFQDVDEIKIAVDIPESLMASDLRASDILQLTAEFAAAPGVQFPVYIKEVAQRADPVTQTFSIRVAMKAPEGINLLPGMTSSVSLTYRRADILGGRILVPLSAVFSDPSGEQVTWTVGEEMIVGRRVVKIGEATGGQIEIVEGLQPGDRIATAGVSFLREGMKVRDLGNALGGAQP